MVPRAQAVFAADGTLSDPKVRTSLSNFLRGFVDFVQASARTHA